MRCYTLPMESGPGKEEQEVMEQGNNKVDWTRRRTYVAAGLVAVTLTVGILIGSVVSGRVSAMKTIPARIFSFISLMGGQTTDRERNAAWARA